jgi:hypothetical protein
MAPPSGPADRSIGSGRRPAAYRPTLWRLAGPLVFASPPWIRPARSSDPLRPARLEFGLARRPSSWLFAVDRLKVGSSFSCVKEYSGRAVPALAAAVRPRRAAHQRRRGAAVLAPPRARRLPPADRRGVQAHRGLGRPAAVHSTSSAPPATGSAGRCPSKRCQRCCAGGRSRPSFGLPYSEWFPLPSRFAASNGLQWRPVMSHNRGSRRDPCSQGGGK